MSHDICPDTGEPCTCDGSEPCTCGCGGCGHTAEEEAAASAYRESHREAPSGAALDHERKIIVSFDSTFDVMECEQLCLAAGVLDALCRCPVPSPPAAGCAGPCRSRVTPSPPSAPPPKAALLLPTTTSSSSNHHKGACPQCGGLDHEDRNSFRNTRFVRQVLKNASTCIVIKTKHLLVGLCETLLQQCDIIHTR